MELRKKPEGEKLVVNVNHNKVTSFFQIYNDALSQLQILNLATKPEGDKNSVQVRLTTRGANRWFGSIETFTFLWYLRLVSSHNASRNSGQVNNYHTRFDYIKILSRVSAEVRGLAFHHCGLGSNPD